MSNINSQSAMLRTWNEFVKVSRHRGLTDTAIQDILKRNQVPQELIQMLLDKSQENALNKIIKRKDQWKIGLGIFKILAGTFLLLAGQSILGTLVVTGGCMWIMVYISNGE